MSKKSNYEVFPEKPKIEFVGFTAEDYKEVFYETGVYLIVAIVLGVIGFVLTFVVLILVHNIFSIEISNQTFMVVWIFGGVATILLSFLIIQARSYYEVANKVENRNEEAKKTGLYLVTSEAESLTLQLNQNLDQIVEYFRDLPNHLNQASSCLKKAEFEYTSNAYSPFWDAVENATQNLAQFSYKANQISASAEFYYGKLRVRDHNFPVLPVRVGEIPKPSEVVAEFSRVIRLGQTNFQFANIWEHRRTREVIIAGFHNLGDAVNNLGFTIENSMNQLQSSISSGFGKLDNRMLEQNRMLDNIQHRREPGAFDEPKKI